MPLTVLNVAYPLAPVSTGSVGGAEQVVAALDAALCGAGHTSLVVAAECSEVRGTLISGVCVPDLIDEAARLGAQSAHRRAIRGALREHAVDLVHMHGIDFHEYLPDGGVPVLVTLHLPPAWYPAAAFATEDPALFYSCVSPSQRCSCPGGARIVATIENGVDLDALRPDGRKSAYAVALGRICPEKGFHIAAKAAVRARVPLVLAGQVYGYDAHRVYFEREIVPRLSRTFRFVGPVGLKGKRRLLARARCLVVPSLAEETGSLAAMEAMACGTPVVAFPRGALAAIVEHGRTGFLVRDELEMAEAIVLAAALDPGECRRAAVERFSSCRMAEEYLALYREILDGSRRVEPELLST